MRTYAIERSTAEWCTILHALEAAAPYDDYEHVAKLKTDIGNMLRHDENHCRDEDDYEPLPHRIRNASYVDEILRMSGQAATTLEMNALAPKTWKRIRLVLRWLA